MNKSKSSSGLSLKGIGAAPNETVKVKQLRVKRVGICKLSDKQKEFFYLELFSMLEAGMDIKKSLDIMINQQKKEKEKALIKSISCNIIEGMTMYEAMLQSKAFTPYEYYCVQIGEESGQQLKVLSDLASYFNSKVKLRSQIMKSLSYPFVIVLASVGAITFMLVFIVPMFSDIFNRFEGELPIITKFFIALSEGASDYFLVILVTISLIGLSFKYALSQRKVREKVQKMSIAVPFVGHYLTSVYTARMCASMSLLISARVPLISAIKLVCKMVDFCPLQEKLKVAEEEVLKGNSFHDSLVVTNFFDDKTLSMIRVGEEVNKLDKFFDRLKDRFSSEIESKTNALNTFLEPLIIVLLGGVIGLILVAMYLPMFKLSTSMGM